MARIEGVPASKAGLMTGFAYRMARRRFGKVPEPLTLIAHHTWLVRGVGGFELALEKFRLVDARLKALAQIKVATLIGCPF